MASERPQPRSKLQELFPNTKTPIIISAPMLGVSNGTLAAHVSKAGGLGIVPVGHDLNPGSAQLAALEGELKAARSALGLTEMTLTPVPIGVGFLTFDPSAALFRETALPILEEYLPQAVWLFAPDPKTAETVQPSILEACHDHGIKVLVQVGTVAAAREAARHGADVIVAQGVDAGGHQFGAGAGVISLVPEIKAMLDDDFMGKDIALVAAGGIADPSAIVAAIALGADGVVMGTKFIPAKESKATEGIRKAILEARDGGSTTLKSKFHDEVRGITFWPEIYDGRAIITESYKDHLSGMSIDENKTKFCDAERAGDASRQLVWAGTGVGLVKDAAPAADIVRNMREAAKQRLRALRFAFDNEGKDSKDRSWVKELGHTLYRHK